MGGELKDYIDEDVRLSSMSVIRKDDPSAVVPTEAEFVPVNEDAPDIKLERACIIGSLRYNLFDNCGVHRIRTILEVCKSASTWLHHRQLESVPPTLGVLQQGQRQTCQERICFRHRGLRVRTSILPDEIASVYILSLLPLHLRLCEIYFAVKSPMRPG